MCRQMIKIPTDSKTPTPQVNMCKIYYQVTQVNLKRDKTQTINVKFRSLRSIQLRIEEGAQLPAVASYSRAVQISWAPGGRSVKIMDPQRLREGSFLA